MPDHIFEAIDATWAPAVIRQEGPWLIRDGQGGGKRVSAVSAIQPPTDDQINKALHHKLFMIRPEDFSFDQILKEHGYQIIDPVDIFTIPTKRTYQAYDTHDVPTTAQKSIWTKGGIGPARLSVMARTKGPKTHLAIDQGTAFIAIHKDIAMVHAIEVAPSARRQGKGRQIMNGALDWAHRQGAQTLALAVTTANIPAQNLYHALGMTIETHYHYRIKE